MLRKGRLYEMPVDEVAPEASTEKGTGSEMKVQAEVQEKGKEKTPTTASSVEGLDWINKRDRELFEWMLGGNISAEDFFDKYWEQEPLLVQRTHNKGKNKYKHEFSLHPRRILSSDYYAGLITKDELTKDLLEKFDIQFTRNLDITSYQGSFFAS